MSHLDPERLAALADDEPTTFEAKHLAACAVCERERAAYRALLSVARAEREASAPAEPLVSWEAMAPALHEAGVIRTAGRGRGGSGVGGGVRWWMQAAAALLLAAGGVAVGRATAGASILGRSGAAPVAQSREVQGASATGATGARLASSTVAGDTMIRFASVQEAQARLTRAEREYRKAMEFLALNDTTSRTVTASDVYRARLAALDAMAGAARSAVNEVPHDPVMNQYYLSTLAAREATLKQLGSSLPQGATLVRY